MTVLSFGIPLQTLPLKTCPPHMHFPVPDLKKSLLVARKKRGVQSRIELREGRLLWRSQKGSQGIKGYIKKPRHRKPGKKKATTIKHQFEMSSIVLMNSFDIYLSGHYCHELRVWQSSASQSLLKKLITTTINVGLLRLFFWTSNLPYICFTLSA